MAVGVDFLNGNNVNNINTNFQRVKNALQEVVGRDGNLPNHMNADLDMNNNDILNVKELDADSILINGLPIGQFNGTFKGLWSSTTTYLVNDVVRDTNGNLWIAKQTNVDITPGENASWTLFMPGSTVADGTITVEKTDGSFGWAEFDNRADAIAYSPVTAPNSIRTRGYTLAGDGGGALYKKVASEPSHNGKLQTGDGTWYELAETVVTTKMFGAQADGTTDDAAAINAAVAFCKTLTNPHLVLSAGRHLCGSLVTFDLPDYSRLTFLGSIRTTVSGTTCVRIGNTDSAKSTFGLVAEGIEVDRASIDTNGSIGVELRSLAFSKISLRRTWGFSIGVFVVGGAANGGFSYNEIHCGYHHDSTVNMQLTAISPGYCNENHFYGGSFNHSSSWPADTASVNLEVAHYASSHLNNNRFMFPSFEDNQDAAYARAANIAGENNLIYHPRMENPASQSTYTIALTSNSLRCSVVAPSFSVRKTNISDAGSENFIETEDGVSITKQTPASAGYAVHQTRSTATSSAKVYSGLDSGGSERFYVTGAGLLFASTALTMIGGIGVYRNSGTPEGNVSAPPGSICLDITGGPPWFKNSGSGATGWLRLAAQA